ncbi:MAG: SDR family oxidoreductase [Opitutales bacterium]|nr:SDR family oxidoreductase [Opitutales bacterium]MCH8540559.1 SDR family oxidoreductase [Opitutales bacterium]
MTTQTKIALIGGINGGIGSALTAHLKKHGWTVLGFSRSGESIEGARKVWSADATQAEALENLIATVLDEYGAPTAYFHCIGSIFLKPVHLTKPQEFEEVLQKNLYSAFHALRLLADPIGKNGGGSMTFVSTVAARTGLPNHETIAAAKAGLEGLVRGAASTYAPRKVRINAVALGLVDTPGAKGIISSDAAKKASAAMHPLNRIGKPEEVASLMAWLAGEEGDWVTGQIWNIDGGMGHLRSKPKV